jgi:hypothetical protein
MTGHLIHVGYPKSGSNFLRRWFRSHPHLAFDHDVIAGFRSVHDLAKYKGPDDPEIRYRVTSSESLIVPRADVGDLAMDHEAMLRSQVAEAQAAICARLSDLFPKARILIVTRGFESAILSAYSQYVRTGVTRGLDELPALIEPAIDQANYDRAIALYRRAFGEEPVIVLPYELLRDDPAAFTGELARRLRIAPAPPPAERVNVSITPAEMLWYPRLSRSVQRLPLGRRLRSRLWRLYVEALATGRLAPLARLLDARGAARAAPPAIDPALLERFRGTAECLRAEPLYAPYAADYLL